MYFQYGKKEMNYLKSRDAKLSTVIDALGFVRRETEDNLFSSIIYHITGQQLSSAAQASIFSRLTEAAGSMTPASLAAMEITALRKLGLSLRKATCIKGLAQKVVSGAFDLGSIADLADEDAIRTLCNLDGVGRWTAEMLLLFCLKRRDIFSYGDLALRRGLKKLYGLTEITPDIFAKYRKLFSPYGSIAAFYIWEVAHDRFPVSGQESLVGEKTAGPALDSHYRFAGCASSPLGPINMLSDGTHLTGLWFSGTDQKLDKFLSLATKHELAVFQATRAFLNVYFSGRIPCDTPPVKLAGTPFQMRVWAVLLKIPYGRLTTYGDIAALVAKDMGLAKMSAQAVGGAVGRNPIAILVPCHRVIGKGGALTGYAGGLDKKAALLALERADFVNTWDFTTI